MRPSPSLQSTCYTMRPSHAAELKQAVRKIPDSRNGHRQTIFAVIAILLSALSGIDMGPSREDTQAKAPLKRVQVGEVAPDFTLRTPDGSSRRLSELRGRKTLVLIFFRGTW